MWLDDLIAAMPPPVSPLGGEAGWEAVESATGLPVPSDLKAFVAAYGEGGIGGFIWLLHPGSANRTVEMARAVPAIDAGYATLRQGHPASFPLPSLPAEGSFLPWALTDNGDHLGWIVEGRDPDLWPVAVLDDEDGVPERFPLPLGAFLVGLVTGELRPEAVPPDVFATLPLRFEPAAS